jgi:C4-dicarboxylate-specific signal transduction histidine kinase
VDDEGRVSTIFGTAQDITERKQNERAQAELNQHLIDTSRYAGMAEVATDVLHNVGNVLNSVNISTSLLLERVRQSRYDAVVDYARLVSEHREQFAEFLLTDPRGRLLPEIMVALADHLATEKAEYLREIESLAQSVEHLKQIVAMQQSYASLAGTIDTVPLEELVEDALRFVSASLENRKVQIKRTFAPVPPVTIDRHKVVQTLLNVIRNAMYALDSRSEEDRHLALEIAASGENHIAIRVEDNGGGIAPADLGKIFSFGHTTRPDGRGFGLHYSANAAREMGGELTAYSAGLGQGATFTLRLRYASAPA